MAEFDFNALMQNPLFTTGMGLLSQARTYGRPGSLAEALQTGMGLQQMQQGTLLNQMKLAQLKRQQEEQERQQGLASKLARLPEQFMRPAVQGAMEQGMIAPNLPIQSQQGQMLAEQMGQGVTVADLLALNQAGNYAQQGTPQEMPLQGRPAQMDLAGLMQAAAPIQAQLDPMGYFKDLQGQAEEARKRQEWNQYIANLPPEIRNNTAAMTVLGGGPELAGKLGPGVLPSVLRPQEKKSPTSVEEYEFAKGQGFTGSYLDFVKAKKEKPSVIQVGGIGGLPKPKFGYRYTPEGTIEAVPGGPAAEKEKGVIEKEKNLIRGIKERADLVVGKVDDALKNIGPLSTGVTGQMLGKIPATAAYNLEKQIDTIKANIGFGELQAMRQASPTGGALGQVAVQELNMLQAVLGSLDKGQSPDELVKSLKAVKTHYQNWKKAVDESQQAPSDGWKDL